MADKTWKAFERRVGAKLGGRRIPVTGERAGADVLAGPFCVQVKLGRRCPVYLRKWLAGIRQAAAKRGDGQTGLVVWKPLGARDADALVVLALEDWQAWHGPEQTVDVITQGGAGGSKSATALQGGPDQRRPEAGHSAGGPARAGSCR